MADKISLLLAQLKESPKIEPRQLSSRNRLDGLMASDMFSEQLAPSLVSSSVDGSDEDHLIQSILSIRLFSEIHRLQQKPTDDLLRMALKQASRYSLTAEDYNNSMYVLENVKIKIEQLLEDVNRYKGSKLPSHLLAELWKLMSNYGDTSHLLYMHLSSLLMWKTQISERTINEQQDLIAKLETDLKVQKKKFNDTVDEKRAVLAEREGLELTIKEYEFKVNNADAKNVSRISGKTGPPTQAEYNRLRLELASTRAELSTVKEELMAARDKVTSLQMQLEEDQALVESKDQTIDRLLNDFEDVTHQLQYHEASKSLTKSNVKEDEKNALIDSLRAQILVLESELRTVSGPGSPDFNIKPSATLRRARKTTDDIREKMSAELAVQNENSRNILGQELKDAILERERIKMDLQQQKIQCKKLEEQLAFYQQRDDDSDTDCEDQVHRPLKSNHSTKSLELIANELGVPSENVISHVKEMKMQLVQLKNSLSESQAMVKAHQDKITDLEHELQNSHQLMNQLKMENHRLQQDNEFLIQQEDSTFEIDRLQQECISLKKDLKDAHDKIKQLEQEMEEIQDMAMQHTAEKTREMSGRFRELQEECMYYKKAFEEAKEKLNNTKSRGLSGRLMEMSMETEELQKSLSRKGSRGNIEKWQEEKDIEIQGIKRSYESEIQQLMEALEVKNNSNGEIEALTKEIQQLKAAHESEIQHLKAAHELDIQNLNQELDFEVQLLKEKHEQELSAFHNQSSTHDIEQLKRNHEQEIRKLALDRDREMEELKEVFKMEYEHEQEELKQRLAHLTMQLEQYEQNGPPTAEFDASQADLEERNSELTKEMERTVERLNQLQLQLLDLSNTNDELEREIVKLRVIIETDKTRQRSGASDMRLIEELGKNQVELIELKTRNGELEDDLELYKHRLNAFEFDRDSLLNEIERLSNEELSKREYKTRLEKRISELEYELVLMQSNFNKERLKSGMDIQVEKRLEDIEAEYQVKLEKERHARAIIEAELSSRKHSEKVPVCIQTTIRWMVSHSIIHSV